MDAAVEWRRRCDVSGIADERRATIDGVHIKGAVGRHSTVVEGEEPDAADEATCCPEFGRILLQNQVGPSTVCTKQFGNAGLESGHGSYCLVDLGELGVKPM